MNGSKRSVRAAVTLLALAPLALALNACASSQGDRPLNASKPEANDCTTSNWSSRHYVRHNRNAVDGFDTQPCYAPATRDIKD